MDSTGVTVLINVMHAREQWSQQEHRQSHHQLWSPRAFILHGRAHTHHSDAVCACVRVCVCVCVISEEYLFLLGLFRLRIHCGGNLYLDLYTMGGQCSIQTASNRGICASHRGKQR